MLLMVRWIEVSYLRLSNHFLRVGVRKPSAPRMSLPGPFQPWERLVRGYWLYSTAILQAMISLKDFRQKHSELQDTPLALLQLNSRLTYSDSQSTILLWGIYATILLTVGTSISKKRSKGENLEQSSTDGICPRQGPSWLIVSIACYAAAQVISKCIFGWSRNEFVIGSVVLCLIKNMEFWMNEISS